MTRSVFSRRRVVAGPSSGDLLSADSFNRANNALSLGSTDGNGSKDPQAWLPGSLASGIQSNQAYPTINNITYATLDLGTGDVDLSIIASSFFGGPNSSGSPGLIFRYTDVNNYWYVVLGSGGARVFRYVAGAWNVMTSASGTAISNDKLGVVLNGPNINVKRNDISVWTLTDSFNQTATRHGIFFEGAVNGPSIDNWVARIP